MLDDEYLRASLSKELRQRERTLRVITTGWSLSEPCEDGRTTSSEAQFLASNEEKLSRCEENIRFLSDAIKSRSQQKNRIASMVDTMSDLSLAKDVVRRLLHELYAHKRLTMAHCEDDDGEREAGSPSQPSVISEASTRQASSATESDLDRIFEAHEKEMIATLEMVSTFSSNEYQTSSMSENQLAYWAEKCAAAETRTSSLEERQRGLQAQLAAKDSETQTLENRVAELQAALQTSKAKEEAFLLLDVRQLLQW